MINLIVRSILDHCLNLLQATGLEGLLLPYLEELEEEFIPRPQM